MLWSYTRANLNAGAYRLPYVYCDPMWLPSDVLFVGRLLLGLSV